MRRVPDFLDQLAPLLGHDRPLRSINEALSAAVRRLSPVAVGAHQVTCSDEAEHETVESFQRHFCRDLLPGIGLGASAAFRTANLGGRYEWKSVRIAEDHYATEQAATGFKLMLLRICSHVAVGGTASRPTYGSYLRYDRESPGCGMLAALFAGDRTPSAREIRAVFRSEGIDRVAEIMDRPLEERWLLASLTQARLQARQATMDLMDHRPGTPTIYLVLASTTLNRPDADGEILGGFYLVDHREVLPDADPLDDDATRHAGLAAPALYQGLGDRPGAYRIETVDGRLAVSDDQLGLRRPARDHRLLIRQVYRELERGLDHRDHRVRLALRQVDDALSGEEVDPVLQRAVLKAVLLLLAEVSAVPAALLLFAEGASGIFQAWEVHEVARRIDDSPVARRVVLDLHDRVEHLPVDEVGRILEVLARELGQRTHPLS